MSTLIATTRYEVNAHPVDFRATFRYRCAPMAETLPVLVQTALDRKGLTFKAFAKRAKISPSGLRKLLRGQVEDARGPTVSKLAKALGLDAAVVRAAIEASRKAR
jgi:predicted transcriptional regulator